MQFSKILTEFLNFYLHQYLGLGTAVTNLSISTQVLHDALFRFPNEYPAEKLSSNQNCIKSAFLIHICI